MNLGNFGQPLSPKQLEVLQSMAEGLSNKAIASKLDIKESTVKNHVGSISRRLGGRFKSRFYVVLAAIKRGLVICPCEQFRTQSSAVSHHRGEEVVPLKAVVEPIVWLKWRDLELCPEKIEVRVHGELIKFWRQEFLILRFLLEHPHRIYSRAELIDHAWSAETVIEERSVDVHVRRLRVALTPFGYGDIIETVRYAGYRLRRGLGDDQLDESSKVVKVLHGGDEVP